MKVVVGVLQGPILWSLFFIFYLSYLLFHLLFILFSFSFSIYLIFLFILYLFYLLFHLIFILSSFSYSIHLIFFFIFYLNDSPQSLPGGRHLYFLSNEDFRNIENVLNKELKQLVSGSETISHQIILEKIKPSAFSFLKKTF